MYHSECTKIIAFQTEGTSPWFIFKMTSSNGNIFRVTGSLCGEFPWQKPVMPSIDIFFDLRLNKRLSQQSWGWWFETQSRSLWRHCSVQSVLWVINFAHMKTKVMTSTKRISLSKSVKTVASTWTQRINLAHYSDVIVTAMASQITSLTIVYSAVYLGTDQRKH